MARHGGGQTSQAAEQDGDTPSEGQGGTLTLPWKIGREASLSATPIGSVVGFPQEGRYRQVVAGRYTWRRLLRPLPPRPVAPPGR